MIRRARQRRVALDGDRGLRRRAVRPVLPARAALTPVLVVAAVVVLWASVAGA